MKALHLIQAINHRGAPMTACGTEGGDNVAEFAAFSKYDGKKCRKCECSKFAARMADQETASEHQ